MSAQSEPGLLRKDLNQKLATSRSRYKGKPPSKAPLIRNFSGPIKQSNDATKSYELPTFKPVNVQHREAHSLLQHAQLNLKQMNMSKPRSEERCSSQPSQSAVGQQNWNPFATYPAELPVQSSSYPEVLHIKRNNAQRRRSATECEPLPRSLRPGPAGFIKALGPREQSELTRRGQRSRIPRISITPPTPTTALPFLENLLHEESFLAPSPKCYKRKDRREHAKAARDRALELRRTRCIRVEEFSDVSPQVCETMLIDRDEARFCAAPEVVPSFEERWVFEPLRFPSIASGLSSTEEKRYRIEDSKVTKNRGRKDGKQTRSKILNRENQLLSRLESLAF